MDIYLAVTHALEESAPVFIAGIIYYIIARVALMQWWMRDQQDEKARAKGRSWLMSLALSGYLGVAGVYYLYFCACILASGTTFIDFPVDHASSWGSAFDTRTCACVMLAMSTLDLAIGSIDYRQQVGILTGWVHHTVYVGLCVYILYTRQTFVLMVRIHQSPPTCTPSALSPAPRQTHSPGVFLLRDPDVHARRGVPAPAVAHRRGVWRGFLCHPHPYHNGPLPARPGEGVGDEGGAPHAT